MLPNGGRDVPTVSRGHLGDHLGHFFFRHIDDLLGGLAGLGIGREHEHGGTAGQHTCAKGQQKALRLHFFHLQGYHSRKSSFSSTGNVV